MNTLDRPDAPTLEVRIARPELMRHNRWNAGYFEERFRRNERKLKKLHSVPLVTIEGEPTAQRFDIGFKEAKNYSRNFKPRPGGYGMQERTVPFLITAAGSRAEMYRAVVRGLNIEYEPIRQDNRPAFLEWAELLAEAGELKSAVVSPQQQVLVADLANQFSLNCLVP